MSSNNLMMFYKNRLLESVGASNYMFYMVFGKKAMVEFGLVGVIMLVIIEEI